MRYDKARADQVRESVRFAVAKALTGTAQALAAASRAAAATASQLRPPEAAQARRPGPLGGSPRTRSATSVDVTSPAPPAPGRTPPPAPPAAAPDRTKAGAAAANASGRDLSELAGKNAKDLIAEVPGLDTGDLRRLRSLEADGKARKTVLEAIDRALEA